MARNAMSTQWKTPNLPGYIDNSNRPGNKRQTLHYSAAGAGVKYPKPQDNLPAYAKPNAQFDSSVVRSKSKVASQERALLASVAKAESDPSLRGAPVATFTAYWKEKLAIGTVNFRYRIFKISIDMDDGEMIFSEQKTSNSGLPQGAFLKKQKIPNGKGGFLMPADLVVGKNISVYARTFHIFSCDPRSRSILSQFGISCPPDEQCPEDPAAEFARKRQEMAGGHAANKAFKKYNEAQLGAAIGATTKLGDFLEFNDHPPLRFFAVWYDRRLYGKLNRYTIDFYLEDRTFHIRDIIQDNSGTDQFHNVYKRATIAKPGNYKIDTNSIGRQKEDAQLYDVTDLYIGNEIMLLNGRNLLLTRCNEACRNFYKKMAAKNPSLFREQPAAIVLPEDKPLPPPKQQPLVPYLGGVVTFGSQEDSVQSCYSLHPIHIKDDPEKVKSNQNHALSFGAELVSDLPTDEGRFFAIKFYLFDDTVAIFETAKKNSGIVPGKFLRRQKVMNPATGKYFHYNDFFVGAQLEIHKYQFQLVDLDAFTMNFAMNRPEQFRWADVESLIKRMQTVCATGTATIGGKSQATAEGDITEKEFLEFLREQCKMSLPEAICCAAFFFKKQELDFDELRRFNKVQDKHLTRLISADTCDTILEDALLDDETRTIKRTFQRVAQGFIDDKLAFTSICDSNMNELKLLDRSAFIKSLDTARYISNIPYSRNDIDVMVNYFFPRGKAGERSGADKEWLATGALYKFLFPEVEFDSTGGRSSSSTTVTKTVENGFEITKYVTVETKNGVTTSTVRTEKNPV